MRYQPVRDVRRPVQRRSRQELHLAGADAGWRHADHDRGTGGIGRFKSPASDAGSVSSKSRPAMRLLHARHGDDGYRPDREKSGADGSRGPPRSRRQYLPLHRLSEHRGIGSRRCGGHERTRDRRIAMSNIIGIGAAPRRKEDFRFLTGRGNYVADVKRADMTFGVFIRSPHGHAVIRAIDKKAALALPGGEAVLTGEDVAADGLGSLPCGWSIHCSGRLPRNRPPFSVLATATGPPLAPSPHSLL